MDNVVGLLDSYDCGFIKDTATIGVILKELRKSKLRRPDIVLQHGETVVGYETGNEVWNLYEQIVVAALDTGSFDLADKYLQKLIIKFPNSIRVQRLIGMMRESEGEYSEALELYASLQTRNPSNILIMKRIVCVYKAQGEVNLMITELNKILTLYPAETPSWLELGEAYLSLSSYGDAVHCFEELVLLDPRNAAHHVRLAEAYYSLGGAENLMNARKHYAMSLTHQGVKFNLRAVYGLIATCKLIQSESASAASSSSKAPTHDQKVNTELLRWARAQLEEAVQTGGKSDLSLQLMISTLVK